MKAAIFRGAFDIQVKQIPDAAILEPTDAVVQIALDLAGAYIEETGCSLSDYLNLYQTHRFKLLNERGAIPFDHPESVVTTFSMAYQKVQEVNQGFRPLGPLQF